jgi:hypothetical protein
MITTPKKRRSKRRQRRGIAPIEFVLWLPLLMFLFWTVVGAGNIFLVNCEVTAKVRETAWQGRDEPWLCPPEGVSEGPLPNLGDAQQAFDKVGSVIDQYFHDNRSLPSTWQANRGLLTAEDSREVRYMVKFLRDFSVARAKCAVLAGVWDRRELPFEDQAQHPRLQPSKKLTYYANADDAVDLSQVWDWSKLGLGGLTSP